MSLAEYQRKRRFNRTPEPAGKQAANGGRSFVIQKHEAGRLHYDFRLELDGVLKSWAVPKGPSIDPSVKRLAMQVEDHPVAYGSFEGVIPEGEYGGGTVMLWDRGYWEPVGDPHEGYQQGRLKFTLHGEKLRGGWMLIRTGSRSQSERDRRRWLLFKERDEEAKPEKDGDVLEELPFSVSTRRTLDRIAADRDSVWKSSPKANGKLPAARSAPNEGDTSSYDGLKEQLAGVRLTHPDKVLYPEQGITKLDLAAYYMRRRGSKALHREHGQGRTPWKDFHRLPT
jgi:bifunctional non-homologous end joining protein LigD